MFAYCRNNPVNYLDPGGCIAEWVVAALVTGAKVIGAGLLGGTLSAGVELILGGSISDAKQAFWGGALAAGASAAHPFLAAIVVVVDVVEAISETNDAGGSKELGLVAGGITLFFSTVWTIDGDGLPYIIMDNMLGFTGDLMNNSLNICIQQNAHEAHCEKYAGRTNVCTTDVLGQSKAGVSKNNRVHMIH